MDEYERYRDEAERAVRAMGAPTGGIPGREVPDEGSFVRVRGGAWELVYTERGQERAERFASREELVYAVVRGVAAAVAQHHEARHRRRGEDSRRQWIAMQEVMVERASPAWADRLRAEHAELLQRHPYDDQLARRADRWGELMAAGVPREEAVAQATREIP